MSMRALGINYDTGFTPGGHSSRPFFDPDQVEREMRVIAEQLHCNAVRITGGDPVRLSVTARLNLGRVDLPAVNASLSGYLASVAAEVRGRFGGKISYAAGPWERLDWAPFDIVAVDGYRDAGNRDRFAGDIKGLSRHGKPVAVTEFGCCCYAGAAGRGGLGWAIVAEGTDPPELDGDYVRDEQEQVRYLEELLPVFAETGVDAAFWFTFATYEAAPSDTPRRDVDLASYGVVQMRGDGGPAPYAGLGWAPRPSFAALGRAYAPS